MRDPQQVLIALSACPQDTIDHGAAALMLSRLFHPSLDAAASIGELYLLTAAARRWLPLENDLPAFVTVLYALWIDALPRSMARAP
jgi:hypothetical protein